MVKEESEMADTHDYRKKLLIVRRDISSLEEQLHSLRNEERSPDQDLHRLALQKALIHTVSDDILREIFVWTLPTATELALSVDPCSITAPNSFPAVLCSVNKRWNTVARDYPRLWASMRLFFGVKSVRGGGVTSLFGRYLAFWLSRAKQSTLQLHITRKWYREKWIPWRTHLSIPDFGRITKLSLHGVPNKEMADMPSNVFDALEDLILRIEKPGGEQVELIQAFGSCPHLRRVAIDGVATRSLCPAIILPWHQISHLLLTPDFIPFQFFERCLNNCPNLRTFALHTPGYPPIPSGDLAKWHWPSITNLSLRWPLKQQQYPLFDHIQVETLTSLRLWAMGFELRRNQTAFLEKLHSMTSLNYLSLICAATSRETLICLFEPLPQITVLDLVERVGLHGVFSVLTLSTALKPLLPRLKTMILDVGATAVNFDDDEPGINHDDYPLTVSEGFWNRNYGADPFAEGCDKFLAFVESRRSCSPEMLLQKIIIYAVTERQVSPYQEYMAGLERFKEEGLEVQVRIHPRGMNPDGSWIIRDREMDDWPEVRDLFS